MRDWRIWPRRLGPRSVTVDDPRSVTADRGCPSARCVPALVLAMAVLALAALILTYAPSARAATIHHPQGIYAAFSDCPLNTPTLASCLIARTKSGELRIGSIMVPINRAFLGVQGGGFLEENTFAPPEEGPVIQPAAVPVPGGLAGVLESGALPSSLRAAFGELVNAGLEGLTATIENAGPSSAVTMSISNILTEQGVAVAEPVKVKLTNPFLGEHCYIGTNSDPIHLNLTEATTTPPPPNRPIKGYLGEGTTVVENESGIEGDYATVPGTSFVDNSFAVPAASGCGGSQAPVIDRAINARMRLPSPAGHNTVVLRNTLELVVAKLVSASE